MGEITTLVKYLNSRQPAPHAREGFPPDLMATPAPGSSESSIWSTGLKPRPGLAVRGVAEHLIRLDLVILDELGYLPFAQSGRQLLFHLISRLYLCRKAEIVSADRTARIGQNMHDKKLILSLLTALFRAVSLQRVIERATPYRTGSHRRSIINAFGESPP
jgi:hypothetical protein